jgi:RNA exonuclease 4
MLANLLGESVSHWVWSSHLHIYRVEIGTYISVDCEMVGVGPNPERESALARVSVVNFNGDQVYDSYVLPLGVITDYRTPVSGVTSEHMKIARPLKEVQTDVAKIFADRIIIGHGLRHDLKALMLDHPLRDVRDTSRHAPYRKLAGGSYPKLKILASELLGVEIQEGQHSSIEDARACMMLFRKDKAAFAKEHSKRWPAQVIAPTQQDSEKSTRARKNKRKKRKG